MNGHSTRARRALAHLAEVDPALGVLALWCGHRDGAGRTVTAGETISYGDEFEALGLPEQVGLLAHHVLHVALRHTARQANLQQRIGERFDPLLFGLAADAIVNETLTLAEHALPRPAILLTDLLGEAGLPVAHAVDALSRWDAEALALALHADPDRARRLREWSRARGFETDVKSGQPEDGAPPAAAAEWKNRILTALEAGRRAGSGIGRLGAILADLEAGGVPWEVHLHGLLAQALTDRPRPSWRRPSRRWIAGMAEAVRSNGPVTPFEPGYQRVDTRPRIVVALDTSSSIDGQAWRLFRNEAYGIARRTGAEVHLLAFDTEVFHLMRLDLAGWPEMDGLMLRRGGGTDYRDLFAKAAEVGPSVAVILTDLDAPLPDKPAFPVIWAVPRKIDPPDYGRVLVMG